MHVALALDVSTSVIGWAVVATSASTGAHVLERVPMLRGHIDLRKNKGGYWSKVDQMEMELSSVIASISAVHTIDSLFIEDPVERFRNGLSSAHTIALLARFNALTSQHARRIIRIDPLYIDATAARKAIGVPLLSKKRSGGVDQKTQCFSFLCETIFMGETWPVNRNGRVQPWVLDEIDATVICWAGLLGLGHRA